MEPNLCVIFPPPVADYMSAVYQDVIEGYLIASVKVCSSTSNEIQWTHWNFIWNVQSNETLCPACWLVHLWQSADTQGSILELSRRQWTGATRWVQCQMGSECGGMLSFFLECWCIYDHSHFFTIFNPGLPQCAFWKTINSYFVDIATFSIFSPNHILHLAARSRQSHRVWVKCFQHETRNSLTAIWLGRKVSEQRRRLWKSCNQQITMQNLANHWEETNSCIFVWSFTRYILRFSMQGINFNFAGRPN